MSERERRRPERAAGGASAADDSKDSGELDEARSAGDRLLAAGNDAIDRVLSGNSEAFLRSTRQEGGQ